LPLAFLLYHADYILGTLLCTNAASFAVKQIGYEQAIFLLFYAAFGTEYIAHAALDALGVIGNRFLRTPTAGSVLFGTAGFGHDGTDFQVFPGNF
jgi:hypothetical protein